MTIDSVCGEVNAFCLRVTVSDQPETPWPLGVPEVLQIEVIVGEPVEI